MSKLEVKVLSVRFPPSVDQKSEWFSISTDKGPISGTMAWRPEENELLILDGDWGVYKGSRVFKFKSAMPNVPVDPRAQLRYVVERTRGMGIALEEKIWAAKGECWREVEAHEVSGLREKVLIEYRETIDLLTREGEKSQVVTWLISKNASINMATAAWEAWKTAAISIVQANPYKLADLPHYGFSHVDGAISGAFGIEPSDPRRIKACIIYCINLYTKNGDTIMSWPCLLDLCVKNTGGLFQELIADCVTEMFKDGSLRGFKGSQNIALADDYNNAVKIWEFLNAVG